MQRSGAKSTKEQQQNLEKNETADLEQLVTKKQKLKNIRKQKFRGNVIGSRGD